MYTVYILFIYTQKKPTNTGEVIGFLFFQSGISMKRTKNRHFYVGLLAYPIRKTSVGCADNFVLIWAINKFMRLQIIRHSLYRQTN